MKVNTKKRTLVPTLGLAIVACGSAFAEESILDDGFGSLVGGSNALGSSLLTDGSPGLPIESAASEPSGWEVTGAAGLALAQGNADSLSFSAQGLATYKGPEWESLLGVDYFYAENEGEVSTDSLRIFGQSQRLLTDRLYLGVAASYFQDDAADLDFRVDVAALLGYHVIKTDRTNLSFEVGPGFAVEDQGGVSDEFATLRFGERFEHQLSNRSKLWQSAFITPQVDDFQNYNLVATAGIDILLSKKWSFRTGVRYLYDNTPADGNQKSDITVTSGLAYSLGGFPEVIDDGGGRATLKPEDEAPAVAALGWTATGSVGFSTAQGNSESLQAVVGYDSAHRTETDEFFLNGLYSFGEDDGETSADSLRIGTRYNRLFSDTYYGGVAVDYLRDEIADLSYRVTTAAVGGYYAVKTDEISLAFEAGPGVAFEDSAGEKDTYFVARAAERFSWILGPRVSFKQDAVLDLDPINIDNYLVTVSAHIDFDVTKSLTWRLAGSYIFDNEPTGNLENADTTLTSSIAVKF